MRANIVSVNTILLQGTLKHNAETLLNYKIEYPEFHCSCYENCLMQINRFYKYMALEFKKRCETDLFSMAIEQYKEDVENNYPIRVFDAVLSCKVTYLHACIISVYCDRYEYTGGAHGNTIRESKTWNLQKCRCVNLQQFFCCTSSYKTYLFEAITSQIEKNSEIYFENYQELIEKTFHEESYYCVAKGLVVYFQQYDIAPYSSGIREFLLPYGGCIINPIQLCLSE